ncbi:MAG: type II toxin-antitoxin system RelE/ParE family toxin [Bosea sp.]|nr:type II toxin-antitoxin system RelE/ParE family toxin [Bosea sp. (in: a-proteobacteria)]
MRVAFADEDLRRLERDPEFTAGFGRDVVRGFRKAMQAIRAAEDSRDLYRGGLRTERLKGQRQHQHSIRLNGQWRLILEIEARDVRVISVEDYH